MIPVLLDHPWRLESVLTPQSVLKRFNDWIRDHPFVDPVPFIEQDEYEELKQRVPHTHANAFLIFRLLPAYIRSRRGGALASPVTGPEDIPNSWKQALRDAMGDLKDWRCPQIATFREREALWPRRSEVEIRVDGAESLEQRVFSVLEAYETHPFATSDFDPWDLRRCHNTPGTGRLTEFACHLPKHPDLENLPFALLLQKMGKLREAGWHYRYKREDRFYYIPPEQWDLDAVSKADWRNSCRTFPRANAGGGKGSGLVDHWGRVWIWDWQKKTHWDVQFPTKNPENRPHYCVISHTGKLIRDPDKVCLPTSQRR
ncbi:MAG TPA: hypothetical protein VHQ22_01295 [Terriglobales bacterium]|jgi:hypothetical protein|nr:hypothetical protein [Terriglobales bacterium]